MVHSVIRVAVVARYTIGLFNHVFTEKLAYWHFAIQDGGKNELAGNKLQLSLLLKWQIMVRTIFSYTAIGLRVSLYICIVERPFIYLFAILYRSYTITKKVQLEKVCLSVYYLRSIKMLTIAIVRGNYTTYFDCNSMSSQDYKCQLSATNQFMIILKYKLIKTPDKLSYW